MLTIQKFKNMLGLLFALFKLRVRMWRCDYFPTRQERIEEIQEGYQSSFTHIGQPNIMTGTINVNDLPERVVCSSRIE